MSEFPYDFQMLTPKNWKKYLISTSIYLFPDHKTSITSYIFLHFKHLYDTIAVTLILDRPVYNVRLLCVAMRW